LLGRFRGRGFHDDLADCRVTLRGRAHCRRNHGLGGSTAASIGGRGFLCRLDDALHLSKDHDAVIALLEPGTHDLELDLLALLRRLEIGTANVEVAGEQDLEWRHLRVDPDLALESHRHSEGLSRVGHTDIRLKLHGIFQTSLDKVCTSQRMFKNSNATVVDIAFGDADALILVTKLSKKASFNIALQVLGVHMDISDESTTFKERITHAVCSY
jgi:hypothetical protein